MEGKLTIDTNDLRQGKVLIKVIQHSEAGSEAKLFVYSDGVIGKLIVPPNTDLDAKLLEEIIRILVVAYPKIDWKLTSNEDESLEE